DDLAARRGAQRQAAETVPLRRPSRGVAPWLAAAACLLVAGGAVWWGVQQRTETKPIAPVASRAAGDRAALVASATDLAKITWTVTPDQNGRGATGDVVWSAAQQKGYMRFVGLKPNDPTQYQYQLWIFDKTRDQAFPVDGGVFDVSSDGEVIVPISPKLHVNDLAMFAVTVEKPGGVVVSKRERIVVTATRT
ncbi:MAG TPA: anti-sigma factor, partial [Kofleriaceae bacterium]